MKQNSRVKAAAAILALLLTMALGSAFGAVKMGVPCPLRTAVGIVRVVMFEQPRCVVRRAPHVVVARAADAEQALISYQAMRGFAHLPKEQMGGMMVFSNGSETEWVSFSVNRYYSLWQWQE